MTSSLVGSEMCIRDRFLPPFRRGWGISTLNGVSRRRRRRGASPPSSATVSYTHLTLPTICSV
eukprot:17169-Prorocentrum_lima.AAC.1